MVARRRVGSIKLSWVAGLPHKGVPTVRFTWKGRHPRQVAEALDEERIYVWDGNYYALAVTERLGLEESGGMVRVGQAP